MTPFLLYQLKVAASLTAFTLLYYLLFRKETFYRFNRFYLLASILLSHVLPVVKLPIRHDNLQITIPDYGDINMVDYTAIAQTSFQTQPVIYIPQLVYGCITVIIALYLIYQIISMVVLVVRKNPIRLGNYRLIRLPEKNHSFSFFNLIFLNASPADVDHNNQVLQHEMAHARQLHSMDILIIQVVKIFQWFNPSIYLTEKAMHETHEYLADQAVMEQNGSFDQYRLLLLTQVFGIQPGIFSYFNYSLIKNRLIMMTKKKSPFRNRLKYLVVIPLVVFLSLTLCNRCTQSKEHAQTSQAISPEQPEYVDNTSVSKDTLRAENEPAYIFVEKQAQFQGENLEKFREWVQENLIYPPEAVKNGIFGKITLQFAVDSRGNVCDVKILRGVDPLLDNEIIRVMKQSPGWSPAEDGGKKVKQQFVIPVIFQLQE